jgi:hypothetical protein
MVLLEKSRLKYSSKIGGVVEFYSGEMEPYSKTMEDKLERELKPPFMNIKINIFDSLLT